MQAHRINRSQVLLICPSSPTVQALTGCLDLHGFIATSANTLYQAICEVSTHEYPVVLLDLSIGVTTGTAVHAGPISTFAIHGSDLGQEATVIGTSSSECSHLDTGLLALQKIRDLSPVSQIVILVSNKKVDLATCCRAVTLGAASFIEWHENQPIDRLVERLNQAYERYLIALEEGREIHSQRIFDETGVAGKSELMAKLLFQAKRAALVSDAPILITGESGTGKQLLAEAIHRMDPKRKTKPFVSVNCAAITGTLAESALFGHRKGAFTGATEDRPGYFRAANGGTILLDEISELDKALQPKLLRVLQESLVLPVGDDIEKPIDVRVIASCNRPLPILVEKNDFRLDLYQRLNVISLEIPPLRDRPEDIPLLVQFFLRRYADYYPQPITGVDGQVYELLSHSIGSGNVRELENAIRRILAFKRTGTQIELSDIPPGMLNQQVKRAPEIAVGEALSSAAMEMINSGRMSLGEVLDEFEQIVLREALARNSGSYTDLAERLGLSRRTFYNKLRKYNLSSESRPLD